MIFVQDKIINVRNNRVPVLTRLPPSPLSHRPLRVLPVSEFFWRSLCGGQNAQTGRDGKTDRQRSSPLASRTSEAWGLLAWHKNAWLCNDPAGMVSFLSIVTSKCWYAVLFGRVISPMDHLIAGAGFPPTAHCTDTMLLEPGVLVKSLIVALAKKKQHKTVGSWKCVTVVYYIDTSVLLENIPCVKSIRNYIRDPSGVFSISSLVRISLASFPAFARLFVQFLVKHSCQI